MLMFAGAQSAPQPVTLRAHLPCRHSCPVPGVQGCGPGRRLHRAPGIQQPTTHAAAYQQQLRSIRATGRSHLRGAAAAAAARAGLKLIVIPGAALRVVELAFTAAGRWALGAGRWALGAGRWALGAGRWALGAGRWARLDAARSLINALHSSMHCCHALHADCDSQGTVLSWRGADVLDLLSLDRTHGGLYML